MTWSLCRQLDASCGYCRAPIAVGDALATIAGKIRCQACAERLGFDRPAVIDPAITGSGVMAELVASRVEERRRMTSGMTRVGEIRLPFDGRAAAAGEDGR